MIVKALEIKLIEKSYKNKKVLDKVSLEAEQGEVIGLLGPNGAGKTTLLKIISGLSRPDSGQIRILGEAFCRDERRLKSAIGLVPQDNNMEHELSIRECMESYALLFGIRDWRERVAALIKQFGMTEWSHKTVEQVSGGMARRAMIARAMVAAPELLLLDEPTVGLDPDMRQEVWQVIEQLRTAGKTVVLTTHYMDEADKLCDRIAFLKNGTIRYMDTADNLKRLGRQAGDDREEISLETAFLRLLCNEAAS